MKPGKIRTIQNWIGPKGCLIEEAILISPIPEEVSIAIGQFISLYE